jgi:hypothetical protein
VPTIKSLLTWIAAIGGLALALLLIVTGKAPMAIFALSLLAPMVWDRMGGRRPAASRPPPGGDGSRPASGGGRMTREEAYSVLGLAAGASAADIQAAYLRLMRAAHPDNGGSDWLAARVNMARDTLVGRGPAGRG